ncbi:MAG TPA: TonB-dependent receptor, partial [Candidatus Angelobacter sp.]|nr:TonB-dependent receptor [Candidatus Angelobacter sp.]
FKIFSWWQVRSSYSYINLDLSNEPGNADTSTIASDEGSSPHNQVEFRSLLTLPRQVEFDTAYRYVSALPAQGVQSYQTLDAHIGWRFSESYGLSVDGTNLLQPHHAEFGGLGGVTAIRRSIYGEITWTR